jgi:vacuolar-type H+-ATPase subunit B/Vma2
MSELDFNGFFDALSKIRPGHTPIWVEMSINIFGCSFKAKVSPESYSRNFSGKTTPFEMRVRLEKDDGTEIRTVEINPWESIPHYTQLTENKK